MKQTTMEAINAQRKEGKTVAETISFLNDNGYTTKTGKKWNVHNYGYFINHAKPTKAESKTSSSMSLGKTYSKPKTTMKSPLDPSLTVWAIIESNLSSDTKVSVISELLVNSYPR